MTEHFLRPTFCALLSLSLLLLSPQQAVAEPVIARILLSLGQNTAVSENGEVRKLKRKSPLYAGDTITTSARGRVQLRFSDGSLLSLQARTEFAVNSYQFDQAAPDDGKAVYQLIKGGMRTVTGLIGRKKKANYQLRTAVATIGIRGTHYNLYLCDAGCAGRTRQPEGLFGGVTRGGIRVTNSRDNYDLGVDDFFYMADRDAKLQPLLAPPELLNEEVPEDGDSEELQSETDPEASEESATEEDENTAGEDENATDADAPDEDGDNTVENDSEGATTEATSTESTSTDPTSADSSFGENSPGSETLTEQAGSDALVNAGEVTLIPASDANTNQTSDLADTITSTTTSAPTGAVMGLSFVESEASKGLTSSGGSFLVNSDNTLLLDTIDGIGNIPVLASVSETTTESGGDPCNPCTVSTSSAVLTDTGGLSGAGLGINWGRWTGSWTVTINGVSATTADSLHFIYSPNRTSDGTLRGGLSGVYRFDLAGFTSPTDESNNVGQYRGSNYIDVDFDTQMIVDLKLGISVGGKTIDATPIHDMTAFEHILTQNPVELKASCGGGSCGGSTDLQGGFSIDFIGSGAERIISSWGFSEDISGGGTSDVAVSGVSAYQQGTAQPASSFSIAPPDTALIYAFSETGGSGKSKSLHINSGTHTTVALDSISAVEKVPVYAQFDLSQSKEGRDCQGCELSLHTSSGAVVDSGFRNETGKTVYWGRWDSGWSVTGSSDLQGNGSLHYIHSPDKTPNSVVNAMTGIGTYNHIGGTLPTDETGVAGSISSGQVVINFDSMLVTGVDMQMSIGSRTISVQQSGSQSVQKILDNAPIGLTGTCTGTCSSTLSGEMHMDFVGPAAERIISGYGLNGDASDPSLSVSGTAVFDK